MSILAGFGSALQSIGRAGVVNNLQERSAAARYKRDTSLAEIRAKYADERQNRADKRADARLDRTDKNAADRLKQDSQDRFDLQELDNAAAAGRDDTASTRAIALAKQRAAAAAGRDDTASDRAIALAKQRAAAAAELAGTASDRAIALAQQRDDAAAGRDDTASDRAIALAQQRDDAAAELARQNALIAENAGVSEIGQGGQQFIRRGTEVVPVTKPGESKPFPTHKPNEPRTDVRQGPRKPFIPQGKGSTRPQWSIVYDSNGKPMMQANTDGLLKELPALPTSDWKLETNRYGDTQAFNARDGLVMTLGSDGRWKRAERLPQTGAAAGADKSSIAKNADGVYLVKSREELNLLEKGDFFMAPDGSGPYEKK